MSTYEYSDGEKTFEGYIAFNNDRVTKRPCVLVGHAWNGPDHHFNLMAEEISRLGYIGFAIDVYGKGVRGKIDGDNSDLMNPLLENRQLLRKRLHAAFKAAQKHPLVLNDRIAMIGHCFGGLCALDLARANPDGLRGVVSIHGLLSSLGEGSKQRIDSSVLVLHGWEDPMVQPSSVLEFAKEMTEAGADWQIHSYGHAKHAFTFIGADIHELGIKYDEKAHMRSVKTMKEFLNQILMDKTYRK